MQEGADQPRHQRVHRRADKADRRSLPRSAGVTFAGRAADLVGEEASVLRICLRDEFCRPA
ncbi:hypothetical protein ACU4GD_20425 [Cupriavidus basilensis]